MLPEHSEIKVGNNHLPSQSAPTILVLKNMGLFATLKKVGCVKVARFVFVASKEKGLLLSSNCNFPEFKKS